MRAYGDLSQLDALEIRMGGRRFIDEAGTPKEAPAIQCFERGRALSAVDVLSVWAPNWACLIPKTLLAAAGGYNERIFLGEAVEPTAVANENRQAEGHGNSAPLAVVRKLATILHRMWVEATALHFGCERPLSSPPRGASGC